MKGRGLILAFLSMLVAAAFTPVAEAETVTIAPEQDNDFQNCYPFGGADLDDPWLPFAAFVYQNVPAFDLISGDILAFDLEQENDADVELDIAMSPTTTNGGDVQAEAFQTVVTNSQTPASRGDTTRGNFELRYTAQDEFDFSGGGLLIRFSNPSPDYALDGTCTGVLNGAIATDPSGFFVGRRVADADGVAPWDGAEASEVGAFRVTETDPPETKITKRPKKKTRKAKATFRFESDEAGSTFECKLDKKAFKPCESPRKYKRLDPKRHKFKVRSIDTGENVDPTPAKRKWKVLP